MHTHPRTHFASAGVFVALALVGTQSCVTPNLVRPAGHADLGLSSFPSGAVPAEIAVNASESLRGVYVPPENGAQHPRVVLHFLASACSLTTGGELGQLVFDIHGVYGELAHENLASLVFDWRGVGASSGTTASEHLIDDARAAWRAAVQRAGGDEKRVILRGSSIGALAIAALLEGGAHPAAVVIVAPVRAETIARRWVASRQSFLAAVITTPFLKQPIDVDLVHALHDAHVPLLVFAGRKDELLDDDERTLLECAVKSAGGRFVERPEDHIQLVFAGGKLLPEELEFVRALAH